MRRLLFFFLFVSATAGARKAQPTGGFLELTGGFADGSSKYQDVAARVSGFSSQVILGARPLEFLKLGVFGIFDTFSARDGSTDLGKGNHAGYGGMARVFFFNFVFIEGGGGMLQTNFEPMNGNTQIIADGSFYYTGPGVEINFGSIVGLVLKANVRNVIYPKNEFENTSSFNLYGALSFYF